MTKIIRKRKKVRMLRVALLCFVIMGLINIATSTLLRAYNVSLLASKNRILNEITEYEKRKETLQLDIAELTSYTRVMTIAQEDGLAMNQGNIVSVVESDENEKD